MSGEEYFDQGMDTDEQFNERQTLRLENARYAAMIYSIVKRHPHATDWNLELKDVADDVLPEKLFVGWNTVGDDAILTVLFGDSLQNMITAATTLADEEEEEIED